MDRLLCTSCCFRRLLVYGWWWVTVLYLLHICFFYTLSIFIYHSIKMHCFFFVFLRCSHLKIWIMRVPLLVRAVKEDVFKFIYTPSGFCTIINICFFTSLKYTYAQGWIPPYFYLRFLFFLLLWKFNSKKLKHQSH